jgi:hypothetical protein
MLHFYNSRNIAVKQKRGDRLVLAVPAEKSRLAAIAYWHDDEIIFTLVT